LSTGEEEAVTSLCIGSFDNMDSCVLWGRERKPRLILSAA